MTDPGGFLEVGRIGRAHGIRGEVTVTFVSDRDERRVPGARFVTDDGDLTVTHIRAHGGKFLVRFDGVDDRNAAEALTGTSLRAEPLDDDDTLWVHELIDARMLDVDGVDRGVVVEVQANPASDLLVLDDGTLVPVAFVIDRPGDGTIVVEVPPGLFELNSGDGDR